MVSRAEGRWLQQVNRSWELNSDLHSFLKHAAAAAGQFFVNDGVSSWRQAEEEEQEEEPTNLSMGAYESRASGPEVSPPGHRDWVLHWAWKRPSLLQDGGGHVGFSCMFVPGGAGKGTMAPTTPCLKSTCEAAILAGASWLEVGERKGFNPG